MMSEMSLKIYSMRDLLIFTYVFLVLLSISTEGASAKVLPQRLSTLHIVNGTESLIREEEDGFIYCYSSLKDYSSLQGPGRVSPFTVVWTDPKGRPLLPFSQVNVNTEKLFSVQQAFYLPNSYLVFRKFDENLEGIYTCNLLYYGMRLLAIQKIRLKMFRPTFRVVAIPRCLTVREGGAVLIPTPVIGKPARPPIWRRIGGENDLSTVLQRREGLFLQGVQESAVYRAVARLGGGLTHQQDVTVSVILHDGQMKDLRSKPRVVTSAPSKCLREPIPGVPLYSSSVIIANDLIADMQMASYSTSSSSVSELED